MMVLGRKLRRGSRLRSAVTFARAIGRNIRRHRAAARRRTAGILKPYVNLNTGWRKFARLTLPIGFGLFGLVYGFAFAVTAPYLIVPFSIPIVLLALLGIWALPDRVHAPTKAMELCFAALLICLILWPNYLALTLPGLPWITAIRLTGFPMALLLLVSASTSAKFRREIQQTVHGVPDLWVWLGLFVGIQFLVTPVATSPGGSLQKAIVQQVNWTSVTLIAAWLCRHKGRANRYLFLIVLLSVPVIVVGFMESAARHLLWAGHVPSFLKIDDPIAAVIFASVVRAGTNMYRAKAVFSTPLGLAEFLGLLTPLLIHFSVNKYNFWIRAFSAAMMPVLFYGIRLTDARLGVIAYILSVFFYVMIWGMLRFKRNRRDLLAATLIYAFPAAFVTFATAVTTIRPIHRLVFGGGAQAGSNEARVHQLVMGIPSIMSNPLGHGGGGGGKAMGYAENAFVAIDNYYLLLGLEYGVLGLVTFLGIFILTIVWSVRTVLQADLNEDPEVSLLIPLSSALGAFLVVKSVFAQADLHPMIFMTLGASLGLIHRARETIIRRSEADIGPSATPAKPDLRRRLTHVRHASATS